MTEIRSRVHSLHTPSDYTRSDPNRPIHRRNPCHSQKATFCYTILMELVRLAQEYCSEVDSPLHHKIEHQETSTSYDQESQT
jgi:hypothetical protein